jgi:hypothetical protein
VPDWGNILPVALAGAHQTVEVANTGPVAEADISVKASVLHLPEPRSSGQLQPERKTYIEMVVVV